MRNIVFGWSVDRRMNLEALQHGRAKSQYKNKFSEALKKRTHKKPFLKASVGVKMRLTSRFKHDMQEHWKTTGGALIAVACNLSKFNACVFVCA